MLERLSPKRGSRRLRRRIGRGTGSGRGRTAGRGQKGAGARSGHRKRPWYEGGQMPLVRRVPKRGFTNIFRVPHQVVNVGDLHRFAKGTEIDAAALTEAGLVRGGQRVKLLGGGELQTPLQVKVDAVSASARQKIESAGGSVEIVSPSQRSAAPKGSRS